jgi:hypothetical protein
MLNQRLVATATDRMYNTANEALDTYEVREQDGVSVQRPVASKRSNHRLNSSLYYF